MPHDAEQGQVGDRVGVEVALCQVDALRLDELLQPVDLAFPETDGLDHTTREPSRFDLETGVQEVRDPEPPSQRANHELGRARHDHHHVTRGFVLANQRLRFWIDRLDHHLVEPAVGFTLELVLAATAKLEHRVLGPVADVQYPELVLQIGPQTLQHVDAADLAALVAISHVETGGVLRNQGLVHVEEGAHPGLRAALGRRSHRPIVARQNT